ncbi:MAG: phosphonopyruvate decarboxylase [Chitinophagaceae bacterium]
MIVPERLYDLLKELEIDLYTGVPDSLLKHFLKYLQDNCSPEEHIITANEGLAIALASGYHFRTGKTALVYLQNSGLGNIINPLTSLADKEMYAVPMLLLIGWRGRPGLNDEPQHAKMGRITTGLLDTLEVPYYILDAEEGYSFNKITEALALATREQKPVALLVPEDIFEIYEGIEEADRHSMEREEVIREIILHLSGNETVVCTTGKSGREFYEQNIGLGNKIKKYLLSVGAMGHASHIALGLKIASGDKVVVLDGDGALLMQMGALPTIAHHVKANFIHIVINNGSHESVGGQPTEGFFADCSGIAKAAGYRSVVSIRNHPELKEWLEKGLGSTEMQFVEIKVNRHGRSDLDRPAGSPKDWKKDFMNALRSKDQ